MFQGLYYCSFNQSNQIAAQNTFCVVYFQSLQNRKVAQVTITSIIIFLVIYEVLHILKKNNYQLKPSFFNFISIVCLMMFFSLLFNILYALFHQDYVFLYLQILFANLYFLVVFSYVGYNIAKKGLPRITIHIIVLLFAIIFVGIFIDRMVTQLMGCKQIWFLAVDLLAIVLSIVLFGIFLYKQRKQNQRQKERQNLERLKNEKFEVSQKVMLIQNNNPLIQGDGYDSSINPSFKQDSIYNSIKYNPFPAMWIMILANIISQIASLIETIMFQIVNKNGQFQDSCDLSRQKTSSIIIIQFVFVIFGYYLGFLASLYTFNRNRNNKKKILQQIKEDYNSYYQNQQKRNITMSRQRQVINLSYQNSRKNEQFLNSKFMETNKNEVSINEQLSLEYQL